MTVDHPSMASDSTCLICGSGRHTPWPAASRLIDSVFDGQVVRCRGCGFCWIAPRPAPHAAAYEEDYFGAYEAAGQIMPAAGAHASRLEARLVRLEALVGGPGRVLDAGIGDAGFLRTAAARGWDVLGTDVSSHAATQARQKYGIDVIMGTLEDVALPRGHFDAVHLSHVVEHLHDPVAALENVRASLRPGGWIVVEVPNEFTNALTRVRLALGIAGRYAVRSTHVSFFDPGTLTTLLEGHGFTVRRLTTFRDTQVGGPLGQAARRLVDAVERRTSGGPLLEVFAQSAEEQSNR